MSLQKKATDNLVQQLLNQIGDHAHVIGPGARVDVLDSIYVGRLIDLLEEAFPGTPSAVFHKVNPSLIVMTRDLSPPNTSVVRFTDSRLRIPDLTPGQKRDWSEVHRTTCQKCTGDARVAMCNLPSAPPQLGSLLCRSEP